MAKCRKCGKTVSRWTVRAGFCNECYPQYEREQKEKLAREAREKAERVHVSLQQLVRENLPNEAFNILAVACWKDMGTRASNALFQFILAGLFGIFGAIIGGAGAGQKVGLVGTTDTELFVIEVGSTATLGPTPDLVDQALKFSKGNVTVKSAPLQKLKASCSEKAGWASLSIRGTIKLKAFFYDSYEKDNSAKAIQMAQAIQSARLPNND